MIRTWFRHDPQCISSWIDANSVGLISLQLTICLNWVESLLSPIPSRQFGFDGIKSNFFSSSRLYSCSYSLFLLIYLSYCVKDFHFYIFTDLFINCREYIEWYYLNSPYIANIWKCAQYIHLFQPNSARAMWRFCVPLLLPHIYRVIAQGMRILWCYNPNKSFYIWYVWNMRPILCPIYCIYCYNEYVNTLYNT